MRPNSSAEAFIIIICTYKRPALLSLLLEDIKRQSVQPSRLVIVDGDSSTKQVTTVLEGSTNWPIVYVPSNYANVAYQRYLGWLASSKYSEKIVIYLDDDLRINQHNALEIIIEPLRIDDRTVVGVTAPIIFNNTNQNNRLGQPKNSIGHESSKGINSFGRGKYSAGSLTPMGCRILPDTFSDDGYGAVEWAYGGVMAFKRNALGAECFLEDSFALHQVGLGTGEDTLISHIASFKGKILLAINAIFLHPNADSSKAVPQDPYKFGYACSYSRWLINSHLRSSASSMIDRWELIRSLCFANFMNVVEIMRSPSKNNAHYAKGYFLGSLRGLIERPSAKHLTPQTNWQSEAQRALSETQVF